MRVAVIMSDIDATIGGAHTFEQEICHSLKLLAANSRHEFFLVTRKPELYKENSQDIHFINYKAKNYFSSFKRRLGLKRNAINLDGLFADNLIDFVWYAGAAATDLHTELAYLSVVWDLQHRRQPFFPEVSRNGLWEEREKDYSRALRRAAIIIAGNETAKREIELFYQVPGERIHILPQMTPSYTLEAVKSNVDPFRKYNLPERYLFYPAQFWPHKNHINLVNAFKQLKSEQGADLSLVLVGSNQGNIAYVKQHIKEQGLGKDIHILGYVPQEDLIALYQNAFALVYVSLFGPENLPPLEALALGCPVIAMNVPGMKEQLGDRVLYAEPGDIGSIALQINKLLDTPALREELVARGLQAANSWTGNDFVKGVMKILDDFEYYKVCWSDYK